MEEDLVNKQLKIMEVEINRLTRQYRKIRTENIQLKQQLTDALQQNTQLTEKINVAAYRLEKLLSSLPEEKQD